MNVSVLTGIDPELTLPARAASKLDKSPGAGVKPAAGLGERSTVDRVAALIELTAHVQMAENPEAACRALAVAAADYLQATRVVIGLCRRPGAPCEVVAISDMDTLDPRSQPSQLAQAALQEVLARREPAVWPASSDRTRHALLAHRRCAGAIGAEALVSGLFRDDRGRMHGAWLVAINHGAEPLPWVTDFLRGAEFPLAAALQLQLRAERSPLHGWWTRLLHSLRGRRKLVAALAVVLLGTVLALPTTNQMKCSCALEPVVRRHISAPFDGPLEKALVEPGDLVQAGQLLAVMDGRETRWELAGVRASYHRAEKERAGHMANHDSGKAELAKLEADGFRLRMELLEQREENLRIRSPLDGIVVSGDLRKVEGMPLSVGQELFEIAPLDAMVVELLISADDIAYVEPGMTVTIRLDGSPFSRREARIERIQPRSEVRDTENVFIAELRVENNSGELRPGMRGNARITGGRFPLGWNLFRKPLGALVAWLGW